MQWIATRMVVEQIRQGGLQVGEVIAGRYEAIRLIAEGGMSSIFMGRQLGLDRRVAIKVLSTDESNDPEIASLFRREAVAIKHLTHPNTVRIYDFGETETGLLYLVMEYLDGECLDQVLYKRGSLPPSMVARIGEQVLKSLIEAHARGIVHRDLKPSNLMLCRQLGEPNFIKVLDFGIAFHRLTGAPASPDRPGEVMGTPRYMSPEQLRGDDVDPRSDLYSLGLTLFELVTGEPVFPQSQLKDMLAERILGGPIRVPEELEDSRLGYVIARALEDDVDLRFHAAGDMLEALIATPDTVWPAVSEPILARGARSGDCRFPRVDGIPLFVETEADLMRYALDPTLPRLPGKPVTTSPSVRVIKTTTPVPVPCSYRRSPVEVSNEPSRALPVGEVDGSPLASDSPAPQSPSPRAAEMSVHDLALSDLVRSRIEDRLRRRTLMTALVTLLAVLVPLAVLWLALS